MSDTIIWGVKQALPLKGFPAGKTRIRMRNDSFTVVFVRPTNGGIRMFYVVERDGCWAPSHEINANVVVAP